MMLTLLMALACRNKDYTLVDSGLIGNTDDSAPVDTDGDGFLDPDDCDPNDPAVNPNADEVCNGIDDDCDGDIDGGAIDAPTWYTDADEDGYGGEDSVDACEQPSGAVALDGDCDDSDAAYHPGADEDDCSDPNDYNCDGSVGYEDADGDGWAACEECDDSSADVNPDGVEVCNEIDDDCDELVDDLDPDLDIDSTSRWYRDADSDGYGDPTTSVLACDAPEGYLADLSDCDDADGDVNPAAIEICNGDDDDCDGLIDDDDDSLESSSAPTWYDDSDGDGYGDATTTTEACTQPSGTVSDDTDCDDGDGDVNPAASEVCNGIDDDCDGDTDEDSAVDADTWYEDADGDGYGDATSTTSACDQPSDYVDDDSDCDDSDADISPGASELCDGVDNDCDGDTDEDDATDASTWYADADGDGYGDASDTTTACDEPSGYDDDGDDCDDTDRDVNPGETEVCNGIDDDCDGDVDDDDSSLDTSTQSTWYDDSDGDGYGDASASSDACDAPSGAVSDATDCDDSDADVSPAATEICDSIDNDCDGDIDDDDSSLDTSTWSTWYDDSDGDGYGDASASSDACDAPSGSVSDATDCDDDDSSVNPGATESCNATDDDCDSTVDEGASCPCNLEHEAGVAYLFCETTASWTSAQASCATYGYHLVSMGSSAENTWVDDTADSYSTSKWWMGLNDIDSEGTFAWDSGESVSYTNWHSGEPNDSGGNEDCGQLNRWTDYTWNDEPCSSSFRYICEAP